MNDAKRGRGITIGPNNPWRRELPTRSEAVVQQMAEYLLARGGVATEADAIRLLAFGGFALRDIALFAEKALLASQRRAVSRFTSRRAK